MYEYEYEYDYRHTTCMTNVIYIISTSSENRCHVKKRQEISGETETNEARRTVKKTDRRLSLNMHDDVDIYNKC